MRDAKQAAGPLPGEDWTRTASESVAKGPRALRLALDICAKCGTCAKQCHVSLASPERSANPAYRAEKLRRLQALAGSPLKRLMASAGLVRGLDREELKAWAREFYECSCCRRCAKFCPFGIDNAVITRKARAILHAAGLTPSKLAATQEAADRTGNDEGVPLHAIPSILRFVENEIREEYGVAARIPVDEPAEVLFSTASSEIMGRPENLMGVALFFHAAGIPWTMSTQAFDAANFGLFTGDDKHMQRKSALLHEACLALGARRLVIGECGHAYRVARFMTKAGRPGSGAPYETTHIFAVAAEVLRRGGVRLDPDRNPFAATYHDPCNFARSGGVTEEPRMLLKASVAEFREMHPNRELNWCCGGGGGLAVLESMEGVAGRKSTFHDFRMNVSGLKKLEQIRATGAAYVAAPCFNCMRQIGQFMEHHGLSVQVGGVFDLVARAVVL